MKYITIVEGKQFIVEIVDDKHVRVDEKLYEIDFETVNGQPVYSLIVDGKSHESYIYQDDDNWQVLLHGRLYPVTVEDEREKRLRAAAGGGVAETGEFHLRAPMPGLVVAIPIAEGQEVKRGQVIGYVGKTGNAADPHLHFAIFRLTSAKQWWRGTAIDPYAVFK